MLYCVRSPRPRSSCTLPRRRVLYDSLYVTQSAPFVPVQMVRDVHPFGKEVGNVTTDFTDFRALGPLDPAMTGMFDLGPDAKYGCSSPAPGDQCQSGARANAHAAVLRAVSK